MFILCNEFCTTNSYSGSDWNFEKTKKYIFVDDNKYVEAGYFIHYLQNNKVIEEKKHVIELPSSYGCPMKCMFCASSQITNICELSVEQIYELFIYIYNCNNLRDKKNVLVSMKGIGDLYFTINNVENFMKRICENYKNINFSISSCYWTKEMLRKIELMMNKINFRTIQITYITHDIQKLKTIIRYYEKKTYDIDKIVEMFQKSNLKKIKINYIMIKGVNDSEDDFNIFMLKFKQIRNKIVVRITSINDTGASKKNGIIGSSIERMQELKKKLLAEKYDAYLFYSFNNDGMNCGQLITEKYLEK